MFMTSENNKRIARNTLFLYLRMLISMLISLYTSRVVLRTLGVEDFGIYGVVGGVVSMFSFLNSSMAGATSRFLTFELGKGDHARLKDTFSTALLEHVGISLLIVLIAETAGLWFLREKLVIPEDRYLAAQIVYQFSILSMVISVIQVPFNASVIAHERMDVYAYIEILHALLKLLVVYLLVLSDIDKLISYSVLLFGSSVLVLLVYMYYCIRHFTECRLRLTWRPEILRPMLGFSGWDIYGNMSVMARSQGVNMLLNIFFGPVLNAASSIASQVQGAVMAFATSVITAFRPPIVKSYATEAYDEMVSLIGQASRMSFMLLSIFTIPLIVKMDVVLSIWLGEVPPHAVSFCSFTLLFTLFSGVSTLLVSGIHATGKIKRPSLINGSLYLSVVPVSYWAYSIGMPAWTSYLFNVFAVITGMLSNAYTLQLYVPSFSAWGFIKRDLSRCLLVFIVSLLGCLWVADITDAGIVGLILTSLSSCVWVVAGGYYLLLPPEFKRRIYQIVKNQICEKG